MKRFTDALLGTSAVFVLLLLFARAFEFPAPITKCHVNNETCMVEQANNFVRAFPKGNPEMGLPSLEPFKVAKIDILGDKQQSARLDLYLTDANFHNYSTVVFTGIKGFQKKATIGKTMKTLFKSYIDTLTIKAHYIADGQVLVLPIKSEGELEWRLTGLDCVTKVVMKPEQRSDGKIYFSIVDYQLLTKIDNFHMKMTNLFNGDKALSDQLHQLVNENWRLMGDDIVVYINKALAREHKAHMNKFFKDIPYDEYFLPDGNVLHK